MCTYIKWTKSTQLHHDRQSHGNSNLSDACCTVLHVNVCSKLLRRVLVTAYDLQNRFVSYLTLTAHKIL